MQVNGPLCASANATELTRPFCSLESGQIHRILPWTEETGKEKLNKQIGIVWIILGKDTPCLRQYSPSINVMLKP